MENVNLSLQQEIINAHFALDQKIIVFLENIAEENKAIRNKYLEIVSETPFSSWELIPSTGIEEFENVILSNDVSMSNTTILKSIEYNTFMLIRTLPKAQADLMMMPRRNTLTGKVVLVIDNLDNPYYDHTLN